MQNPNLPNFEPNISYNELATNFLDAINDLKIKFIGNYRDSKKNSYEKVFKVVNAVAEKENIVPQKSYIVKVKIVLNELSESISVQVKEFPETVLTKNNILELSSNCQEFPIANVQNFNAFESQIKELVGFDIFGDHENNLVKLFKKAEN